MPLDLIVVSGWSVAVVAVLLMASGFWIAMDAQCIPKAQANAYRLYPIALISIATPLSALLALPLGVMWSCGVPIIPFGLLFYYLRCSFDSFEMTVQLGKSLQRKSCSPKDFVEGLDLLAEIALRALCQNRLSLFEEAVAGWQDAIQGYLRVLLPLATLTPDQQAEVLYTLERGCDRLAISVPQALQPQDAERFLHPLLVAYAKAAVAAATAVPMVAVIPIEKIGKIGQAALAERQNGVTMTLCTFVSLVRELLAVQSPALLAEALLMIVKEIEKLIKESFSRDRKANPQLLLAPLRDIKESLPQANENLHELFLEIERIESTFGVLETLLAKGARTESAART